MVHVVRSRSVEDGFPDDVVCKEGLLREQVKEGIPATAYKVLWWFLSSRARRWYRNDQTWWNGKES